MDSDFSLLANLKELLFFKVRLYLQTFRVPVSWQTKQYSFIQCLLTYLYIYRYTTAQTPTDTNRVRPVFAVRIFCLYVSVATCPAVYRNRADVFYLFCLAGGITL